MRVLRSDHRNETIIVMRYAKCYPKDTSSDDAVAEQCDGKLVKEGLKLIILDEPLRCSTVLQLKAEGRPKWSESPLHIIQRIRWDSQAIRWSERAKLSQITSRSTSIMGVVHSFLSLMRGILNYLTAFELQYRGSSAKILIKYIVDDMMPPRYFPALQFQK